MQTNLAGQVHKMYIFVYEFGHSTSIPYPNPNKLSLISGYGIDNNIRCILCTCFIQLQLREKITTCINTYELIHYHP